MIKIPHCIIGVLVCLLPSIAVAQEATPDGGVPRGLSEQVVFVREGQIFVTEDSAETQLTNLDSVAMCAGWMPDGNQIIFTASENPREVGERLFIMNADGSSLRALTADEFGASGTYRLQPSPDGTHILWIWYNEDGAGWLIVDSITGEAQFLETTFYVASWSPDSTQFAMIEEQEVQIYDLTVGRRITSFAGISDVAWSPDGTRIATTTTNSSSPLFEVTVVDVDGTNPVQVLPPIAYVAQITWAPDGKHLALNMSDPNAASFSGNYLIAIVNVETGEYRYVSGPHVRPVHPLWSSDSQTVSFFESDGQRTSLYAVELTTDEITTLAENVSTCNAPLWRP